MTPSMPWWGYDRSVTGIDQLVDAPSVNGLLGCSRMNVRLGKERNVAVSKTIPASAAMASEESVLWLAQGSEGRKIPLRSEDARPQTGEGQRGPSNGEPAGPGRHDRQEMGHPS